MAQPTLLLKGSFDSFSIDDVLDVVGLSRQTMRVVLDDQGRGGEFLVKAGRVIRAAAPPAEGRRAFVNIYREPGQGFAVWQHVDATGEPIGLLADLIEEAKVLEKEPARPSRTPILAGSFNDHRLDEVLDVLNMTRQLVEFKVMREDESRVTMILKAGQVLACEDERASTSGLSAFRTLFKDHGTHFEVVRLTTTPDDLPAPIGRLPALVQQALKEDDQASKKRAGVLFQGAFQNFPLSDVLEALSVTRLTVEMVFHDADGTRGTFVLKAGQVLAAQALRTGASGREAFLELMTDPGESFVVVRRPGTPTSDPIGQLRDLLNQARSRKRTGSVTPPPVPRSGRTATPAPPSTRPTVVAAPPVQVSGKGRGPVTRARTPVKSVPPPVPAAVVPNATPKPVPKANPVPSIAAAKAAASTAKNTPPSIEVVLDGTFDNFVIDDVLQVLSISRQYVALGTLRSGVPLARLVVKSSRVLMASYGSVKDPVQAMAMLLEDPGTEFRVRRLPRYADSDLGSLAEIVKQARASKPPATLIHLPRPAPAPEPEPEADSIDLDDLFDEEVPPAPKPKPKPEPVVEARAKARAKAKTKARLEADGPSRPETSPVVPPPPSTSVDLDDLFDESKAKPESQVTAKPESQVTAKPESQVTAKPESKVTSRIRPRQDSKSTTRPESKITPKPESKATTRPQSRIRSRLDSKITPKPEPEPEDEPEDELNFDDLDELAPETTPESEAKVEAKPEPEAKVEAEPEPEPEAKVEAEPEPEAKVEAEPEPKVEAEPEPEAKVEAEPEPEAKVAAEPEPEAKVAAEPEAKVEAKAEVEAKPVTADLAGSDAIVRSLALIEERLRDQTAAMSGNETVEAFKSLTVQLEEMNKRMQQMTKETNELAKKNKSSFVFLMLVAFVAAVAAWMPFFRP